MVENRCPGGLPERRLAGNAVNAAEVNVISSTAMREVLEELVPACSSAPAGTRSPSASCPASVLPGKVKEGAEADGRDHDRRRSTSLSRPASSWPAAASISSAPAPARRCARARRSPTSARPKRSRVRCSPPSRSATAGSERRAFQSVMARLGIFDQVKGKAGGPLGERVGALVRQGDAEIGVQQITELCTIAGIDFVGPLPKELQAEHGLFDRAPATAKEREVAAGAGEVPLVGGRAPGHQEIGHGTGLTKGRPRPSSRAKGRSRPSLRD